MSLNKMDARHRIKRSIISGATPAFNPNEDFTSAGYLVQAVRPAEFWIGLAGTNGPELFIGNLSGMSEIRLTPSGTSTYDFCSTGILANDITGCTDNTLTIHNNLIVQSGFTAQTSFTTMDALVGDPGQEADGIDINGTTYTSVFKVNDIGGTNLAQTVIHRHSTTVAPLIIGARSNSNNASHTAVTNSQSMFQIYGVGRTGGVGGHYDIFASMDFASDSTGTVSPTSAPGRIALNVTADGAQVPTLAYEILNTKQSNFLGDVNITTDKGLAYGTGATEIRVTLELGDWDMNSLANVVVNHNLSSSEWKTIRSTSLIIRDDTDTAYYDSSYPNASASNEVGIDNFSSGGFRLAREANGFFHSPSFSASSFNRGFLSFYYQSD